MALPNGLSQVSELGSILSATANAFQLPELVDAPFTSIVTLSETVRKVYDPASTLRPSIGIERVHVNNIKLIPTEKGPIGEPVYGMDGDDRIRFVGAWSQASGSSGTVLFLPTTAQNSYIEVTFFGTGLNLLERTGTGGRDYRASVDGGAESVVITDSNGVLDNRNYRSNTRWKIVSGLSLDVHTVKIRKQSTVDSMGVVGFEILNESSQIQIPQGSILAGGQRYSTATLQANSYNTGFDGNPVLNGRGGHVVQYITRNNLIGKVIQQTEASAAYLTSANHTNEELIRKINFREFSLNRSDDFGSLADTVTNRMATLEDGTTTLTGNDVRVFTSGGTLADAPGAYVNSSGSAGGLVLTFVGTGLDYIVNFGNQSETITIYVDGVSVGTLAYTNNARNKLVKIASGLPFGSHSIRLERGGGGSDFMNVSDFLIYGPKKPAVPEGAQEISEYYLMANYDGSTAGGSTIADMLRLPQGTIFKTTHREWIYEGTGYSFINNFAANTRTGYVVSTTNTSAPKTFYFWGTGFVLDGTSNTGGAIAYTVEIDNVLNATGVPLTATLTNSGGGSYSQATGTNVPSRLQFTGLALGFHKVKVTRTTVTGLNDLSAATVGVHIITPIYFPDTAAGSQNIKSKVDIQNATKETTVDLGKAKAWVQFSMLDDEIVSSHNVASVFEIASLQTIAIRWQKPFKNEPVIVASNTSSQGIAIQGLDALGSGAGTKKAGCIILNGAGGTNFTHVVAFGELEDEE